MIIILHYLPVTAFIIMLIMVLRRAVRFGDENKTFTNATVGVGALASVVEFVITCLNYKGLIWEFALAFLCIVMTLLLKAIVRRFIEDFDQRNQIKVDKYDTEFYRNEEDFSDGNDKFNER